MYQINCKQLSLGYDGVTVCEHIDFTVSNGDYLCIVGDNGSGKTTLMKALLGLKVPDGGEIIWGTDAQKVNIGYLPQQSEHQRDFPATAFEVALSGCVGHLGNGFFFGKAHRKLTRENMTKLGIEHLADKSYSSLSGGQQQRVLLARALCSAKDILLLDEPVSGLDHASTEEMYNMIRSLNTEVGMTVIMITHDIGAALKYATSVLYMGEHPAFFPTVSEYRQSEVFPLKEAQDER